MHPDLRGLKTTKVDPSNNTPRHILIRMTETKHRNKKLKAVRSKMKLTY